MKTFETENNNIPEGATHYSNETTMLMLCWFMESNGKWWVRACNDTCWHECDHNENERYDLKPIPQTKDAEWANGLPPVGSIVHGRFMHTSATDGKWQIDYISESVGVYTAVETGKQFTFATDNVILSKIETEAEKLEREELEAINDIEEFLCSLTISSAILPGKLAIEIVRKTGYRKN